MKLKKRKQSYGTRENHHSREGRRGKSLDSKETTPRISSLVKGERPLGEHTGWQIFFPLSRSSGLISARKTWSGKVSSRRKTGGKYDDAGRKEGRKKRGIGGVARGRKQGGEVSFERSLLRQSRPEVIRELARDFFIIAPLMNLKIFRAARSRSSIGEKTVGKLIRGGEDGGNAVSFRRRQLLNRQRARA